MMKFRYEQVASTLCEQIEQGAWPVGTKIPGELELAKEYHVGRSTIRETLNILQQKGMIEKRHGSGTYVIENKKQMENPLLSLNSVGKMIDEAGYTSGSIFYGCKKELPSPYFAKKLHLEDDERIVIVNRARTAGRQPVAFSYNIFPEKIIGTLLDDGLFGSLFEILKNQRHIEIAYAETELKGLNVNHEWDQAAVKYLGTPSILMEQLHYDTDDRTVLLSYDYIRTDLVHLHIRRS